MPPYGWEYVVLICSPVPLENPHLQSDSAFDLVYPFELLAGTTSENMQEQTKGFGGDKQEETAASQGETISGKRLTVFYRKYWLVR